MWDMNDKSIPVLTVIGHYMVFLHQYELHNVDYPLWIIPDSILLSRDVASSVGLGYSCISVCT